jgi:predicted ATPase with chaperone activity
VTLPAVSCCRPGGVPRLGQAAVTNCGNSWPMARLTLALSPATLPKMGSVYDMS